MIDFYVVLAGHNKVSDAGRDTTCMRKFKAPSIQKVQKMRDLPKMSFTEKPFERFRRKKSKTFLAQIKQPRDTHGP